MENSKSMENVSDQILKVPPDEQKPEPPLVKDEGAAELWFPAPGSRISALHWAAGAGGHEIDQLLSCAETIVHIQINARPLITTQNKYRACTIITIP